MPVSGDVCVIHTRCNRLVFVDPWVMTHGLWPMARGFTPDLLDSIGTAALASSLSTDLSDSHLDVRFVAREGDDALKSSRLYSATRALSMRKRRYGSCSCGMLPIPECAADCSPGFSALFSRTELPCRITRPAPSTSTGVT